MSRNTRQPLAVSEFNFLKTYVTNKDEIIKKHNIRTDADYRQFYETKIDLSKGSYAYAHNVKLVYLPKKDCYVLVDYQLADAVEQLNELGLTTYACCSGHRIGDHGYISFSTKNEKVSRFVDILIQSLWKFKFYVYRDKENLVYWVMKGSDAPIKTKSKLMLAFAEAINNYKKW